MPAEKKDWEDYAQDFPSAYREIQNAIRFLKNRKGVKRVYLVGHSMGARMASAYVAKHPDHGLSGLIVIGLRNNGYDPLNGYENVKNLTIPVLDLYGDGSYKDATHAADRGSLVSKLYHQVAIPEAGHSFGGYEEQLVSAVVSWLKKVQPATVKKASRAVEEASHAM
jgi:pimeloyl-ACP methyl ester carboxylesterase